MRRDAPTFNPGEPEHRVGCRLLWQRARSVGDQGVWNGGSEQGNALDHVVVVVFENRSLDNLLGRLYGPGEEITKLRQRSLPVSQWDIASLVFPASCLR
jgi:hypothetical protein